MITLINASVPNIASANAIKDDWAAKHRFKRWQHWRGLLPAMEKGSGSLFVQQLRDFT
jgi:hypothetical protein